MWAWLHNPSFRVLLSVVYLPICESLTTGLILFAIPLGGLLLAFSPFDLGLNNPEILL